MASRRPARLYQKTTGVFFVRVLIMQECSGNGPENSKKAELRKSLRTKDVVLARKISGSLNACLEGVALHQRPNAVNDFFAHTISTWTLPGDITCQDDDDQRRLMAFLDKYPPIVQALADRIARAPSGLVAQAAGGAPQIIVPSASRSEAYIEARPSPMSGQTDPPQEVPLDQGSAVRAPVPRNPQRFSSALGHYRERYEVELGSQGTRTADDKCALLAQFQDFVATKFPSLGADPWVHEIDSRHANDFLRAQKKRDGKRKAADGGRATAAPATMLKKLSDLRHFFTWAKGIAKCALENPVDDLKDSAEAWRHAVKNEKVHYLPFTNSHIRKVFEPAQFLTNSRDPDYFWCPLVGLHLGVRLGEIVSRPIDSIGHIPEIDTWYIDIPLEDAKNLNSVRRLPITEPLIRLGFLEYVKHVRRLGGKHLFPHRDWTLATAKRDPSKNQSRRFGEHLDDVGLCDPLLVFHSFRHTVVTALQDAGVPLSHSMQIVGHEAIDHAVRTQQITEKQAQSVHLRVYTHADLERMGTEFPILPLKQALEGNIRPPIDYERLALAAKVVLDHLKKVGGNFRGGWPAQRTKYTAKMVELLGDGSGKPLVLRQAA